MLTVCAYFGTIQGEKLNEPEPDLSPICKNKKRPEPGPNGLSVTGPVGFRWACRALQMWFFNSLSKTFMNVDVRATGR